MKRIYLDNAATSWPKPEAVYAIVDRYQRELGAPAGRSVYREANEVERLVNDARRRVARLLHVDDAARIVFTSNGTDSLNLALQGLLRPGDHVISSVAEHNSTLRPLRYLQDNRGVQVTLVGCDAAGFVDPDEIRLAIRSNTRLIALVHVSNVTGTVQSVPDVGRLAHEHGLLFLVDAAQSVGHLPMDVAALNADLLAAPGHKGLLGPLGTGILYIAPGVEQHLTPIRQGGTGTQSDSAEQPATLPDRYESGNHNVPGILGLGAGVAYLQQCGLADLRRHDQELTGRFIARLLQIGGVTVYGPGELPRRVGVVSISVAGYDPQELAIMLDSVCGIQVRAGLHCAAQMHHSLGTAARGGTVRFSLGPFTTTEDIDAAAEALEQACGG